MQSKQTNEWIETSVEFGVARLTLNRPRALNALSLDMIRTITRNLQAWREDVSITHVLMRGKRLDKASEAVQPFGLFCAGGDIRYFYEAVHAAPTDEYNRDSLEAFFTEEYALNHLIHHYPKPILAFMDGVVMGGGMGLTQGASHRIVTERTKMAMPETAIGLFPDVGGGYFLSRCANSAVGVGEYLALTGQMLSGQDAVSLGLADVTVPSDTLPALWTDPKAWLAQSNLSDTRRRDLRELAPIANLEAIREHFSQPNLAAITQSLKTDESDWAKSAVNKLETNSPLMLAVTLNQIRKARSMTLAEDLRMERDMVFHCFAGTPACHSDTVEGIRALVIDKDHKPKWQPKGLNEVTSRRVEAFFASPWPAHQHPLKHLV